MNNDKLLILVLVLTIYLTCFRRSEGQELQKCEFDTAQLDQYMSKLFGGPGVVVNGEFVNNDPTDSHGTRNPTTVPSVPGNFRIGGHLFMTTAKDLSQSQKDGDRYIWMGGTSQHNDVQQLMSAYGWDGTYACNKKWSNGSQRYGQCYLFSD